MRSLREELTWAARESRRASREGGAEFREQARQARQEAGRGQAGARGDAQEAGPARTSAGGQAGARGGQGAGAAGQGRGQGPGQQAHEASRPGRAAHDAWEQATDEGLETSRGGRWAQAAWPGRRTRRGGSRGATGAARAGRRAADVAGRRTRPGGSASTRGGSARRRAPGSAAASRSGKRLRAGRAAAGRSGRAGAAGRNGPGCAGGAAGPGRWTSGRLKDLERVAVQFTSDLRKLAMQSSEVGENVITDLRTILEDALERIKTEIFGSATRAGAARRRPAAGDPEVPVQPRQARGLPRPVGRSTASARRKPQSRGPRGARPLRPGDTTAGTAAGRGAQRGVPGGRPPGPAPLTLKMILPNRSPAIMAAKPSRAFASGSTRSMTGRTPVCSRNLASRRS